MSYQDVSASEMGVRPEGIPLEVLQEIEVFEAEVQRLKRGEVTSDQFKPFRLQHGIYGQRQKGVQMVRVKIPFGGLTPLQVSRLAEIGEKFAGDDVAHVTTRQNIQFHFVQLDNVPTIMRILAEVGLTTREACANTVRNVTACPYAGICQTELFDVTPYALAVSRHFLRNPICQSLPRKFKITFSGGCARECGMTPFHDIGATASIRNGEKGFRITIGGGLGGMPRLAHLLREFVPEGELIPLCEAIVRVFDRWGNRKHRMRARLKFVIEKIGMKRVSSLIEEEYATIKATNGNSSPLLPIEEGRPPTHMESSTSNGVNQDPAYTTWLTLNVIPQKQSGYRAVLVKLTVGDIPFPRLRALGEIVGRFAGGHIRTTQNQGFLLRWVPEEDLPQVYSALATVGLADPGAERVEAIVACPGTYTCGLGITDSLTIGRVLGSTLFRNGDPSLSDLAGTRIRISGCQNSCAQHHIATIGLHGVGKKIGGHVSPHYELLIGGRVEGTSAALAQVVAKIPAKNVPRAIEGLIALYRKERKEEESFHNFLLRLGKAGIKKILLPLTIVPSFEEGPEFYSDWGSDQEFSMEDLGPGECASGAQEMMENLLTESEQELFSADLMAQKAQYGNALSKTYRAVIAAARALLVTEGVDPLTDTDVLTETESRLITKGILPRECAGLSEKAAYLGPKTASLELVEEKMAFARSFVEAAKEAYTVRSAAVKPISSDTRDEPSDYERKASPAKTPHQLDLRGVRCPINYVKTKLRLEEMEAGELLEVFLDEGEPILNVPRSLMDDGQKILKQTRVDDYYTVLIEKV